MLEDCFGIPVFPQDVIGIEIMRRRKTEGDVSTFCVCEIQYSSREVPLPTKNVRSLMHKSLLNIDYW